MRWKEYMIDHSVFMIMLGIFLGVTELIMAVFAMPWQICVMEAVMAFLFGGFAFLYDYRKRSRYYTELAENTRQLDQKYLVLETVRRPDFYEGQLSYDILWECHKSMREHVREHEKNIRDFKEYIEMWVHEVKIPLASLLLMCHNNHDVLEKRFAAQIKKVDEYTDQVLYYTRLEHAGEDYLFAKINLGDIVHNVILKNKDLLLESDMTLEIEASNVTVVTDSKWMEFIINQIFSNSIKYRRESKPRTISVYTEKKEAEKKLTLHIRDNGVGIPKSDLCRVFHKSFTGNNGRKQAKSTGMGLYIVKGLCDRLGHEIMISSEEGQYTDVQVTFQNCNLSSP